MTTLIAAAGGALFGLGVCVLAFYGVTQWEQSRANMRSFLDDKDDWGAR